MVAQSHCSQGLAVLCSQDLARKDTQTKAMDGSKKLETLEDW